MGPRLTKPNGQDLVALRVFAEGKKGGKPKRIGWEMVDYYDDENGISAMERSTGYSLSITGQMQVRGEIGKAGVFTPDEAIPAEKYIRELAQRGVMIHEMR
jgi:lysine 6-dehydrogenase